MSKPKANYADQVKIFSPADFVYPVHFVGCGGIGSTAIFPFGKMGISDMHFWDADIVEDHNVPVQLLYRRDSDLGKSKVETCKEFCVRQEIDANITAHAEFVTADTVLEGIVISGVDSMAARQTVWQAVLRNIANIPFYIDGRIGGEQLQMIAFSPSEYAVRKVYEKDWLFSDEESIGAVCGLKSIMGPPTVLAGLMAHTLTLWQRGLSYPYNQIFSLRSMRLSQIEMGV
jgi:hypothetical protein